MLLPTSGLISGRCQQNNQYPPVRADESLWWHGEYYVVRRQLLHGIDDCRPPANANRSGQPMKALGHLDGKFPLLTQRTASDEKFRPIGFETAPFFTIPFWLPSFLFSDTILWICSRSTVLPYWSNLIWPHQYTDFQSLSQWGLRVRHALK